MSLLNQMLKDLEQRNAASAGVKELPGEIHSVPEAATPAQWRRMVIVALLFVLIGFAAWWSMRPQPLQLQPMAVPVAAVMPAVVPAQPVAAASVEAPPTVAVADTAAMPRLPGMETELHSPSLASPPTPRPTGAAQPLVESVDATPAVAEPPVHIKLPLDAPIKSMSPQQRSDNQYKQALSLLQQGRVAEASDALTQALQEDPANHSARQMLAGLLIENRRSNEAMTILQDGVRIAPEQSGFMMALARLQIEAGDRNAALQTLEQGAKFAGNDAEYHAFYAALLQRNARHDEAVTHYLAALQADPANTSWLVGVGISLQEQGRDTDAREAFERARMVGGMTPELAGFVDQRLSQLQGK